MALKTCFVTVGATASFDNLVRTVLFGDFFGALKRHGYTELLIQYGQGGKTLFDRLLAMAPESMHSHGIKVTGFDLDKAGLGRYMRQARYGVVISHAGSGTILDALRIGVPLVVVPNTDLLDNHQLELAVVLAEQEYVVFGQIQNLAKALDDAEKLRTRQKQWPPPNSGVHRQAKGLKGVLDEEMGFLD